MAGQLNDSWSVGYNGGRGQSLLGLILLAGSEAKTKRLLDRKAVKRNKLTTRWKAEKKNILRPNSESTRGSPAPGIRSKQGGSLGLTILGLTGEQLSCLMALPNHLRQCNTFEWTSLC